MEFFIITNSEKYLNQFHIVVDNTFLMTYVWKGHIKFKCLKYKIHNTIFIQYLGIAFSIRFNNNEIRIKFELNLNKIDFNGCHLLIYTFIYLFDLYLDRFFCLYYLKNHKHSTYQISSIHLNSLFRDRFFFECMHAYSYLHLAHILHAYVCVSGWVGGSNCIYVLLIAGN